MQEAAYVYQELGEKYNYTASLYNGRAVCYMKMGRWEDAEQDLQVPRDSASSTACRTVLGACR